MRNILAIIGLLLLLAVLAKAQGITDKMSAADINSQLLSDLYKRNPDTKKEVIVWDNSSTGYDALYTINNSDFLTHYDEKGNYVETRQKKEWNANVPATVRNSYDKNFNRQYTVETYWEVNDPDRKGYYLELKDRKGQAKNIWVDHQGKVYDITVSK
jgi:hypothetical protein